MLKKLPAEKYLINLFISIDFFFPFIITASIKSPQAPQSRKFPHDPLLTAWKDSSNCFGASALHTTGNLCGFLSNIYIRMYVYMLLRSLRVKRLFLISFFFVCKNIHPIRTVLTNYPPYIASHNSLQVSNPICEDSHLHCIDH